ncbi:MAG: tRNA lysidine(34) synthetase TilS [Flavobacteriales bacterium]|nr:tRNA lysidine(34) synthetase TilS [Flavobacteriales bacterium]
MLVPEVREALRVHGLLEPGATVLVALSGGLDSMVLLHILRRLGHPVVAAHAEHGLRGAEGEQDQAWLLQWCREQGVPFETTSLHVPRLRGTANGSVEMLARSARAEWLHGTALRLGIRQVATAHHRDDVIETLLLNLMRGTGLRGWRGIPRRSGPFIRPLLDVPREAIAAYASDQAIPFREDASNTDPAFRRNRVRHELLPLMRRMSPGCDRAIARSVGHLHELIVHWEVRSGDRSVDGEGIPFELLESAPLPRLVLHEALRHRGVHPAQLDRILRAVAHRRTGARFQLKDGQLLVDRDRLRWSCPAEAGPTYTIGADLALPGSAPVRLLRDDPGGVVDERHVVRLAAARLHGPLVLRPWRAGDRFRPHGGRGSRLVSDLLIDAKVPRDRKGAVYVLCAAGEIAWVVGHRLSAGFAAQPGVGDVIFGVPVP